jgi:hypothetical protein
VRRPSNNAALGTNAKEVLLADAKVPLAQSRLYPLLACMADVLDLAGGGEDIYLTLGRTRPKSAFCLTVSWDSVKYFRTSDNAVDLAIAVQTLVDEAE